MSLADPTLRRTPSQEERAWLARLAAMNAAFEGARAGKSAQGLAARAQSSDYLLTALLAEIQNRSI